MAESGGDAVTRGGSREERARETSPCTGHRYPINPDDATDGYDIRHTGPCPTHLDADVPGSGATRPQERPETVPGSDTPRTCSPALLGPSAWWVVVTMSAAEDDDGWHSSRSLPTFTLPLHLGLCSEESAIRTAREIVDPWHRGRVNDRARRPAKHETLIYITVNREEG